MAGCKPKIYPRCDPVEPVPLDTEIFEDKIRFVCLSDTHSREGFPIPDGDVLLHAGDFSNIGKPSEIVKFNKVLGDLPHKHKIVIAGNHELTFDPAADMTIHRGLLKDIEKTNLLENYGVNDVRELLTNCTYLEDSGTTLYGYKIYGSPWQVEFGGWAFNLPCTATQPQCYLIPQWKLIPDDTDILITHGPPRGHGDKTSGGYETGCPHLLETIQRIKPKYHVFGHIHEANGITTDGTTQFINASICTLRGYIPRQRSYIFDLPLLPGHSK